MLGCDGERWNGTEPLGCRTPPAPSSTEEGSQGGGTVKVLESLESNAHNVLDVCEVQNRILQSQFFMTEHENRARDLRTETATNSPDRRPTHRDGCHLRL